MTCYLVHPTELHCFCSFLLPSLSLSLSLSLLEIKFPEREETKFSSSAGGTNTTGRATAALRLCEGVWCVRVCGVCGVWHVKVDARMETSLPLCKQLALT